MTVSFEFYSPTRIIFGFGALSNAGKILKELGSNTLVISGVANQPIEKNLLLILDNSEIRSSIFHIHHEPTEKTIQNAFEFARLTRPDFIISIGGGSAIDTGKALSSLMTNPGELIDYLEVVGKGRILEYPPIPMVAIPTTSGTGSEVTKNAVLEIENQNIKVSLRSPMLYPRFAIIDPELMLLLPPFLTATTGLDALTQLIEPFISRKANPLIDVICREGIRLVGKSLRKAFFHGNNPEPRADMALASLFGGIALANAKLGAVHGFAAPLGSLLHAAHGAICASLLPNVMEINHLALIERQPEHFAINKFKEVAQLLTGNADADAQDGISWIRDLCKDLEVKNLRELGLTEPLIPEVVLRAIKASSMAGNPIDLTEGELIKILKLSS